MAFCNARSSASHQVTTCRNPSQETSLINGLQTYVFIARSTKSLWFFLGEAGFFFLHGILVSYLPPSSEEINGNSHLLRLASSLERQLKTESDQNISEVREVMSIFGVKKNRSPRWKTAAKTGGVWEIFPKKKKRGETEKKNPKTRRFSWVDTTTPPPPRFSGENKHHFARIQEFTVKVLPG